VRVIRVTHAYARDQKIGTFAFLSGNSNTRHHHRTRNKTRMERRNHLIVVVEQK